MLTGIDPVFSAVLGLILVTTGARIVGDVTVNPFVNVPLWVSGLVTTTFQAPAAAPVRLKLQLTWLASTKLVTFTISIKHNGSTVATWTQSVNSNVWTLYEHTKNVSFNIQAGDTLTYYISSNQYGEGAFLHGGGYAVFYK